MAQQLHAVTAAAVGLRHIAKADPAIAFPTAPVHVQLRDAHHVFSLQRHDQAAGIPGKVPLGGQQIGPGREALQRSVDRLPGIAVEFGIELILFHGIQGFKAEVAAVMAAAFAPPALFGEGTQRLGQVAVVVIINHPQRLSLHFQQRDRGIVAMGDLVNLFAVDPQQLRHQRADDHAVADAGKGLTGMLLGQGGDDSAHTPAQGRKAFAAADRPAGGIVVEKRHLLGKIVQEIAPGDIFPCAHGHLPQARLYIQRQFMITGDGFGGGAGAGKVAAVQGVQVDAAKTLRQSVHLPQAAFGDAPIIAPLGPAIDIPFGFAVANEINVGHEASPLKTVLCEGRCHGTSHDG